MTHKLYHPDTCFIGDEVDGNLSMKGNGHTGDKLLIAGQGSVPYARASRIEKYLQ